MLHIYIIFRKFSEMSYQPIVSIVKIAKKKFLRKITFEIISQNEYFRVFLEDISTWEQ